MNPSVKATWAPVGQTPVVVYRNRHHKKVSVLGALALFADGHIETFLDWYPGTYVRSVEAAQFLERLLREVVGSIVVVWDNLNAHRSPMVREVVGRNPRLTLEYLPPYAPDLNPVEALWCQAKYHRMANHAIDDLATLESQAKRHVAAIAAEQRLLLACFGAAKLPVALYQARDQ